MNDHFDGATLMRGRDYARRGHVDSVEALEDGALEAWVSNGRGGSYRQRIALGRGVADGVCSCPVGHDCKHVVAALTVWAARQGGRPRLAAPVQGRLGRIRETPSAGRQPEARPEAYQDNVKDLLLFVLTSTGPEVKIDMFKGRVKASGNALNKAIRRYDALHVLRGAAPAMVIRPVDMELLGELARAGLWETRYGHGLPDVFRPKGEDVVGLVRRLCETGRFMHDGVPDALLIWSDRRPEPRLAWRMEADGSQRLGFEDEAGQPLELRAMDGAALWIDAAQGRVGALEHVVDTDVLRLVEIGPEVPPHEVEALAEALPDTLA
jgi:hypothetical protein